jgi:hypothetical protein
LKKRVKILLTSLILALIIADLLLCYSFTGNENALLKSNKKPANKEIEKLTGNGCTGKKFSAITKAIIIKSAFLVDMKLSEW